MTAQHLLASTKFQVAVAALSGMLVAGAAFSAGAPHLVSQKGREFNPHEMTINRGEVVQVVNDDGDLLHHVYIDSDQLQFDSGDQKPGSRTDITFAAAGTYAVLCAIHPKMKLIVHVK
jgi:plastocyanin